jgi:hypothetical protein
MTGYPVKMTPAEVALLVLTLAAPLGVVAQDATPPDAALLEFLADWNEADGDWLEAELTSESNDVATDGALPASRAEKDHE